MANLTLHQLHSGINALGYICEAPFTVRVFAALTTRPQAGAFLFGPAGTGKTSLPERLAELIGAELVFQQCFPGTREEDLMVRMVPCDDSPSGIRAIDGPIPETFQLLSAGDKPVVLVLDEWDKTRPSADAFLLDLLQSGRVRFGDRRFVLSPEQRQRLTIFITMNDERDLSEPLLRRLPKIDFPLLPSLTVRTALNLSHPSHALIEPCITLYRRCMAAKLPKPCTLQELRQLIDAADTLGRYADWDSLVYQFVTKTPEQHDMLASSESLPLPNEENNNGASGKILDAKAYGFALLPERKRQRAPLMPSLGEARGIDLPKGFEASPDTAKATAVMVVTENAYDAMIDWAGPAGADPAQIGSAGRITGGLLVVERVFLLRQHQDLTRFWGEQGEVALHTLDATHQDILSLRASGWHVIQYSMDRLVARHDRLELSWNLGEGAELIVPLDAKEEFETALESFPNHWLEGGIVGSVVEKG